MRCPNSLCRGGLVPRDSDDRLARYGGRVCDCCGGSGAVARAALGNVGAGASGKLPTAPPAPGTAQQEADARCHCQGGKAGCTGACCGC